MSYWNKLYLQTMSTIDTEAKKTQTSKLFHDH